MKTIELSNGNKKIGSDTFIINMTPARTCPSRAMGLCQCPEKCYADKSERQYPAVLPYRQRQREYWQTHSAEEIAGAIMDVNARKRKPVKYLRFSEAGDFESQGDVDKMAVVAALCQIHGGISTYGYTARRDLDLTALMNWASVNGSGFKATNAFKVVKTPSGDNPVCPGDCRTCNMCKVGRGLTIEVIEH